MSVIEGGPASQTGAGRARGRRGGFGASQAIRATADYEYRPATKPTLYFVGMSTGGSSIMSVFPGWAEYLQLGDVAIQGVDCRWHDDPAVYRRIVEFIKRDPLSKGALVTSHKIDLLKASRHLFEYFDPNALVMNQISCISKREGRLRGHAKDPVTSGLALGAFVPVGHWQETRADAFVIGAGGASIAITSHLMQARHGANRPGRILVSNRSSQRLEEMKLIHRRIGGSLAVEYHHTPNPRDSDRILAGLAPGSLVVNATGLGKDAPGSPLTGGARFPERALVWDTNYRGDLVFLAQARAQAEELRLTVEDGWVYFIHGWTRVMAEVFDVEIPVAGPGFEEICRIAREGR